MEMIVYDDIVIKFIIVYLQILPLKFRVWTTQSKSPVS